jgi:hypothetical protein
MDTDLQALLSSSSFLEDIQIRAILYQVRCRCADVSVRERATLSHSLPTLNQQFSN